MNNTTPTKSSFRITGLLVTMGIFLFITFTISASITSLNNQLARLALCPSAVKSEFRYQSGGTVDKPGTAQDVSTSVVSLHCEFADGSTRDVENDTIVVTGFATAAAIGAILGALIYVFRLRKI